MMQEIARILKKRKEIAFAYLYGSFAKGLQSSKSDIDIAVYLSDESPMKDPMYESALAIEIESKIKGRREIDVRVLNRQPVFFAYQVVKYGKRIFTRHRKLAVGFEAAAFDRYFDFKPFMDAYDRALERRLLA